MFTYHRTVYLADTDAAGVVYFARVLYMCHEAYEESLAAMGINLKNLVNNSSTALPIVHGEVDFFRPLFCADKLQINLVTQQLSDNEFAVSYKISHSKAPEKQLAQAQTRHVCIEPSNRVRVKLPVTMQQWLIAHQTTP